VKLENAITFVTFNPEKKEIHGGDKRDQHNDPRFYNKTVRGINKAWKALEEKFSENTTMYEAANILRDNGISCHSYCAID
jgi:hypothetical protein